MNWALACGGAWRPKGDYVRVADESAVIVGDAKTKLQHFIRRATFATREPEFGFLVPTPSRPILSEAREAAFSLLKELMAPEIEYDNR